jgi:transcriptional regulator GlxA family with amidase domain
VLGAAGRRGGDAGVAYVSASGARRVTAGYGTELAVQDRLVLEDLDLLIVPGGGWAARAPTGAWAEIGKGDLPRLLASAPRPGLTIAAVCTGVMLLSAAGLTTGRPCVTHRAALGTLAAEGGRVIDARVVDDGDLVTCGGVTSGIDLALWLVERELGADLADAVAGALEYDRTGTVWRAEADD